MRVPLPLPVGHTALRPTWSELPAVVREGIEGLVGSAVLSATSQGSGFTPGFASRLRFADGRRLFVKAATPGLPWLQDSYRLEVERLAVLPPTVPAPRVRHRVEIAGGQGDWLVVIFDDVEGRPPRRPWSTGEAQRVLDAVRQLSLALTPAPAGVNWADFTDEFFAELESWGDRIEKSDLRAGARRDLAGLAGAARDGCRGTTLVHSDLRDDNVILEPTGKVWVCDWNWPTRGPLWMDALTVAISMYGDGLDANRLLEESGLVAGVDREAVDGALALLLSYFLSAGTEPPPDASPYLRTHQQWYAAVVARWLGERRGWNRF